MRLHSTSGFETAKADWTQAYAEYDRLADLGMDHSSEYTAASDRETATLNTILLYHVTTAQELAEKLRIADARDVESWDIYPAFRAQVETDLKNLMRPNCSPTVVEAFMAWREIHKTLEADLRACADDDACAPISGRDTVAWRAVMELPCTTPGDFILKTYLELINGGGHPDEKPFEVLVESYEDEPGEGFNENFSRRLLVHDLENCDLGNCLFALGLPYFDAAAWIAEARRIGHQFNVVIDAEGRGGISQGLTRTAKQLDDPHYALRRGRLMRLLAFDDRRTGEIMVECKCNHPDKVRSFSTMRAEAAEAGPEGAFTVDLA